MRKTQCWIDVGLLHGKCGGCVGQLPWSARFKARFQRQNLQKIKVKCYPHVASDARVLSVNPVISSLPLPIPQLPSPSPSGLPSPPVFLLQCGYKHAAGKILVLHGDRLHGLSRSTMLL